MSAKYHLFKNPPNPDEPEKVTYHVRITQTGTISFRQLCKEVARMSTISLADSIGAITGLAQVLTLRMKEGYTVEIDGFGYFKAIAKAPIVTDPKKIRAESVQYAGVQFKPSVEMTDEMKSMTFERDPDYRHPVVRTKEQRTAAILHYLKTHEFIRSSDCMGLNGSTRYRAIKDLNELCEKGILKSMGCRNSRFYILNDQEQIK